MMGISKSEARRLGMSAVELGAQVLRGVVTIGPDGAKIDGTDISEWLAEHADAELVLIAAPVDQLAREQDATKICYTCGRDYQGDSCPHCAEVRARLRGGLK
jgi:hypothetical protein